MYFKCFITVAAIWFYIYNVVLTKWLHVALDGYQNRYILSNNYNNNNDMSFSDVI